jgi:hypothetical protein
MNTDNLSGLGLSTKMPGISNDSYLNQISGQNDSPDAERKSWSSFDNKITKFEISLQARDFMSQDQLAALLKELQDLKKKIDTAGVNKEFEERVAAIEAKLKT